MLDMHRKKSVQVLLSTIKFLIIMMTFHYRLTLVYVKRLATITDPFILIFLREAFGRPPCLDYFLVEKLNILVEWGSPPLLVENAIN